MKISVLLARAHLCTFVCLFVHIVMLLIFLLIIVEPCKFWFLFLQRQDAWSHCELNGVCRPKSSQSSRCNVFQCQAFLLPSGGNGIPVLKTAATALTKYNCAVIFVLNFDSAVSSFFFSDICWLILKPLDCPCLMHE